MPWTIVLLTLTGAATAPIAAALLRRSAAPVNVPLTTGLTAAASGVVALRHAHHAWLPVPAALTVFAVPLVLADLRHLRLPDVLTLPAYPAVGVAIGAAALGGGGPSMALRAVAGALLFGGVHLLVHLATTLGAGDVKLSGSLGAVLGAVGWAALPAAALLAAVLTVLVAAVRRGRARVPHGPALLTATWLCALCPLPP